MSYLSFNRPHVTGKEFGYVEEAIRNARLSGNGPFTARCDEWLERRTGSRRALLTHSCTGALDMAALLVNIGPGDEVIMPSFTFVSTANAFVLRGAVPVFVDIRPDTLNLDERLIQAAITERTRAIAPVHYAGVGCEMDAIISIAEQHTLHVIEDAAQCLFARYRGRELGSIGDLGALSFHETKNVQCGEGGALLVNRDELIDRAELLLEKGTNRRQFIRGQVDKYSWVDVGSSFLPSEITAAFLLAQLEDAGAITERRLALWTRYHNGFADLEQREFVRRPIVPPHCEHNGHMYYLLLRDQDQRDRLIEALAAREINAVFHYVPLHSAPAGRRYGRAHGDNAVATSAGERLVRLPLWADMTDSDVDRVVDAVGDVLRPGRRSPAAIA